MCSGDSVYIFPLPLRPLFLLLFKICELFGLGLDPLAFYFLSFFFHPLLCLMLHTYSTYIPGEGLPTNIP